MKKSDDNGTVICELDDLLFDVELRDNPFPSNPEYAKVVFGQLPHEGIVQDFFLNGCSNRYELVKNSEIFPKIEEVLNRFNIGFNVVYQHTNHVRFYADYSFTNKDLAYTMEGTNDKIFPMLKVQHSYNGLTKYRITFGYFRLICTNGLAIPVKEMEQFNLNITGKHTKAILASIAELEKKLSFFAEHAAEITKQITKNYEILKNSKVSDVEKRITEILKDSDIKIVDNSKFNTVNHIKNIVMNEANDFHMGYNGEVNDWLIYNAINAYLFDAERTITAPEKRAMNDSKVLEVMLKDLAED